MYKLSICIPTYNFGDFIGETLDSITFNLPDCVEIIILDGGSKDNTEEIVLQKQKKSANIFYYKQDFRGGIDRDIAKAVSLAKGEYCWLFSADDLMKPHAIGEILILLESKYDIYLCEQTLCDEKAKPLKEHPIFNNLSRACLFDLSDKSQKIKYFKLARTSEAFFSYLAGPVFRKEVWDKANNIPDSFYETCWALSGRLLSRVPDGIKIFYIGKSLILKRSGIDSFMDKGIVNRLRITVDGFKLISETIFGKNSFESYHIRRVTRGEDAFKLRRLLSVKLIILNNSPRDILELNSVIKNHFSNAGIFNKIKYFIFSFMPVGILNFAKKINNFWVGYEF